MKAFITLVALFLFASCSTPSNSPRKVSQTPCIITEVEHYGTGQRHTLQIDPEWKITTSCGSTHTLHRPVNVGDTLLIKTVYLKD